MKNTYPRYLPGLIVLIVAGIIGFSILDNIPEAEKKQVEEAATGTPALLSGSTGEDNAEHSRIPQPNLDRPVSVLIPLHALVLDETKKGLASTTVALRTNPNDHLSWTILGVYRKTLGDYTAARDIWLYVAKRWPTHYVAYNNLGNLYHIELRDYRAAEQAYITAAALKPDFIQTYINLYELYRYSYKAKAAKAPVALKAGLGRNPNDLNLNLTLARYYADIGEKGGAAVYFKKSIAIAERGGTIAKAASIRAEAKDAGITL